MKQLLPSDLPPQSHPHLVDLLIPLLILVPLVFALLPGGLFNTADGPVHVIRAAEMVNAWQDGLWLPRWAANLGRGYGLPLFVYAPPLPYLLTAGFHQLGLSLEAAYKMMLLSGALLAVFGAYRLSRAQLGPMAGAVGASAFLYAPIMLRELFIQGNAAQFLAWSFAPWAAWGVIQGFRRPQLRAGLLLALSVMGTQLSHNAAALLVMGMIGCLWLTLLAWTRNWRAALLVALYTLGGLALSAWFWLPALLESKYVRLDRIVASDFRPRFIPFDQLLAFSPRLDHGAINPFFPLTLGGVQVWLALVSGILLLGLIVVRRNHISATTAGWLVITTSFFGGFSLFCALMATRWSEPIWTILPFVNLFEWPFRWHGYTAVGLSWLSAYPVYVVGQWAPRYKAVAAVVALWALLGSALVNLYPNKLPPGAFKTTPADVVRFEENSGAIGTTSLGEFDPIWATNQLGALPVLKAHRRGHMINRLPNRLPAGVTGEVIESTVQRHQFHLSLPIAMTLTLNLLYFPGWQASTDDIDLPLRPHPVSGLIDLVLPAGERTVTVTFGETPLRRLADWISVGAGLVLLLVVLRRGVERWRLSSRLPVTSGLDLPADQPSSASIRWVALCVVLILGSYWLVPTWFQIHTPPTGIPALSTPLTIDFGNQVRLLGVDLPPSTAHAGETVTVISYWRALQRLKTDYGPFLHLDDPTGRTVAAVDYRHPSDIPTSTWSPNLYVRAPLHLTLPTDLLPIRYRLRVGLLNHTTNDWLAPHNGNDDVLEIGTLWVDPDKPVQPATEPRVRFGEAIQLLGIHLMPATQQVTLFWQATTAIPRDYQIFIHLLDASGAKVGQLDAAPYANLYPTSAWRPGQIIADKRAFGAGVADAQRIRRLAIGLYDPTNGQRLAATDEHGQPLPDNALYISATEPN